MIFQFLQLNKNKFFKYFQNSFFSSSSFSTLSFSHTKKIHPRGKLSLIQFIGKRKQQKQNNKLITETIQKPLNSSTTITTIDILAIEQAKKYNFVMLDRLPLSKVEIEAIESGGATYII